MKYDIDYIRSQFPALKRIVNNFPAVYFDGPGGTQVPERVMNKMVDYLVNHNSNSGGDFITSVESDQIILNARKAFADYFNCSWDEVAFDNNSTTINFKLSQAIARNLNVGDEIIITDIDHDSNRSPWQILTERGIIIKSVKVNTDTYTLDLDDYKSKLSPRTKVVAFNYASNAVGTISNAKEIIRLAKEYGAITVADAVHYALHGVINVRDIDVDFLFCSAYKFFGPHLGVLFGRRERMEKLRTLKVSAQHNEPPHKFETGTLNHEGIAGAAEAIEFIADIGAKHKDNFDMDLSEFNERRQNIIYGMLTLEEYEKPLAEYFKGELRKIDGLKLFAPPQGSPCTSTISFRLKDIHPDKVSQLLAEKGIFVWAGNFYAVQLIRTLGLSETGGVVRIGLAPYNTKEEIDRTIAEIRSIADKKYSIEEKPKAELSL